MDVIYILDGLFIFILAVYFQYTFYILREESADQNEAAIKVNSINAQLSDSSLTPAERSDLETQYTDAENELL
jgi:hypothetical protein